MRQKKGWIAIMIMFTIAAVGCGNEKAELEQRRLECEAIIAASEPEQLIEEYVKAQKDADIIMLRVLLFRSENKEFKYLTDDDRPIPVRVISIEKSPEFNELTEQQWKNEPLYKISSYTTILEFSYKGELSEGPYDFSFIKIHEDSIWQLYNYGI